jgi:hypothetical protein
MAAVRIRKGAAPTMRGMPKAVAGATIPVEASTPRVEAATDIPTKRERKIL